MSNVVPKGWAILPLNGKVEILSGYPFKSSLFCDDPSKMGVIRIRDLVKQSVETFYAGDFDDEYVVRRGDILIGMDGDFNIVKWKTKNALLNQRICKVKASKDGGFDSDFLFYSLVDDLDSIHAATGATTVKHLSVKDIRGIEKAYPPLPEQQKIAAILSSVDDVIEKTRAQIDKLKDLKIGMMQELLTKGIGSGGVPHTEFKDSPVGQIPTSWHTKTLGEVFDFKNGVNKDKTAFGHGVPIISYKNVYAGGGIADTDLNALVKMNDRELERFRVRYGDVFFTRTSETPDEIGFTNVYLGNRKDVVFNGFVIRGRQKNQSFDPIFLKYAFQNDAIRKQMMDNSKFTTRAGISGESLARIRIAVPTVQEQQAIAEALDSIQNRTVQLVLKQQQVRSLKKALMQDLLTGKVRVKIDQKESAVA